MKVTKNERREIEEERKMIDFKKTKRRVVGIDCHMRNERKRCLMIFGLLGNPPFLALKSDLSAICDREEDMIDFCKYIYKLNLLS